MGRRVAELNDRIGFGEIIRGQIESAKPELNQRSDDAFRVSSRLRHENVEITGKTRDPVVGQCVRPDDDKINVPRAE